MSMKETLDRLNKIRKQRIPDDTPSHNPSAQADRTSVEGTGETGSGKAIKIRSELIDEEIWLLFRDFETDDGLVTYLPEEIEYLKTLPIDGIVRVHKVKKIIGGRITV